MKLIVGLGNPGRVYEHNRHNIGFICLNHFAKKNGIRFDRKLGKARIGTGEVGGSDVVLAKPQTYMNLSGESVSRLIRKFNVAPDNIMVVHDDFNLPLGKIRMRKGSSSGGHKGVDSIISCLGSQDFIRLRIGIGRPPSSSTGMSEADIIDYVLSDFAPDEEKVISHVIPIISEAIICLLTEGLAAAMNKFN